MRFYPSNYVHVAVWEARKPKLRRTSQRCSARRSLVDYCIRKGMLRSTPGKHALLLGWAKGPSSWYNYYLLCRSNVLTMSRAPLTDDDIHIHRKPPPFSLTSQGDDAAPQSVRVELSSEADLFFHYTHSIDDASFQVGNVFGR